jgi:hypothetical protein
MNSKFPITAVITSLIMITTATADPTQQTRITAPAITSPSQLTTRVVTEIVCPPTASFSAQNPAVGWNRNTVYVRNFKDAYVQFPPATNAFGLMQCRYDGDLVLGRAIEPEFKKCAPKGNGFSCTKN